ncbi:hypothetical protein AN4352.2 [Aspergillus nidulans FGSC A4]|uniref:Mitochondrial carrier protein, putative (AFU_orthologue AFUA_4G06390) n=1 Tax=Emericella nidulans (strain FGSC A4 / ATCC 38163 / CBS 112.46 / NRRL 194 / M139) TaxID=227321 RepID=Q5B528_EMENI|nr:hypothetical protein [Aspergillus nidulans FGSC A4]EAA60513.1 hypothetical protein AN4352.2 [Aspergillus nidulans FGSC A4]CBF77699.1 TPA: mitochondrial carrier protein, putative (AFU_orthologue; AFUA_4G06390) [Aspergillus nidulans FGSC A4]|eukprot:XP_661956.1 hypothetical protein AN4352.2 [Aspergillus nidulans FGSC A4]
MTDNKHSEHAPFVPPSQPSPAIMPSGNSWTMDESTRNRLLKKYKTQVASGTSTVCATLAVTPLENVKTRMQTVSDTSGGPKDPVALLLANGLGPFELAKNVVQTSVLVSNRAQASPNAVRDPSLRHKPRLGTIEAIRQIIQRYGFKGLYTGFGLHAMRDTVGSGLYFAVYETVKQVAARELGPDKSPFGAPMIAGAICSTVPWFCTYPLDTRKTRAQSVLLGKSKEVGEASAAVARSSMYKGLSIILIRTGVNNMILLSIFEYIKMRINELDR